MTTTTEETSTRQTRSVDGLRLVLGTLVLVLGIAVLVSPDATLLVVALLFGLQLLVSGLVRLLLAVRDSERGGRRVLAIALAGFTTLAGVVCVLQPGTSLLVLAFTVALGWFSDGISELVAGFVVQQTALQRTSLIIFGVTSIISAVLIITFPGTSLMLLTQLGGILLVVLAILTLVTAFRSRSRST